MAELHGHHASALRVLHVVFSLEPGGLENGIVNIARRLPAEEIETHVFCLERAGQFSSRLPASSSVYVHGKKPGFSWSAVANLRRTVQELNADIIHSHNLGPLIYSSLATVMGRVRPIVHGEHNQLSEDEQGSRRMLQRRLLHRTCARIHTVSVESRRQFIDLGFRRDILAIPNGVDTDRFRPDSRKEAKGRLGIDKGALVLGIVGRFGPYKRHTVLIDAFEALAQNDPRLHLLIVGGGGPEEETVRRRVVASSVSPRIHLTGFQEHPETFYPAMDLLVVPSINEGLSNAILEAMACSVPVLSHACCGSNEVIEHESDGWVVDLSTVDQLCSQLKEILANPVSLRMHGDQARQTVLRRFSLERMIQQYREMYHQVAQRERRMPKAPAELLNART